MPELFIIAGCNGAGKTTAAYNLLPNVFNTSEFINADEIARGINPENLEATAFSAGKIMLQKINEFIKNKKSFAFETTLSGKAYAKHIIEWKKQGYHITLVFLSLPDAEISISRVAARVAAGGHNIPEATIRRRFKLGLQNFHHIYRPLVNAWTLYDNSESQPLLITRGTNE